MKTQLLMLLVDLARRATLNWEQTAAPPLAPGDLVVEVSKFAIDPDAIGWLVGEGEAAYSEDGTGPTRHVFDIVPLSGARGRNTLYQRWENAAFRKVKTVVAMPMPAEVLVLIAERE